jgi:predicted alpha-1,2-mannosidase
MPSWKYLYKSLIFSVLILNSCTLRDLSTVDQGKNNLIKYANPLIGAESTFELSSGNTYPAVALPFGMNFWTPQTSVNEDKWLYNYDARKISGFRCTHQPSPWMGDYGAFSIMPMTGSLFLNDEQRASEFSHAEEVATPYYYKANLKKYDIDVEMTPTTRGALFNFTFPESQSSYILLDALPGESFIRVLPEQQKIVGYTRNNSGGVPSNFACYFVIAFDKPLLSYTTWNEESLKAMNNEITGKHCGAAVKFSTSRNEEIELRVATSFISIQQAQINFNREVERFTFDQVKIKANQIWNTELNKIKLEGSTNEQNTSFYTAYYRMLLFPRKLFEYDEDGRMVHYSPYDGQVHEGYLYGDIGMWDAFREVFPFFTIMYPEITGNVINGLLNAYREGGWLPVWPSPGYRKVMIGSHAASLFADAYIKNIRNFDYDLAYQAMKKDAIVIPPKYAPGRDGLKDYNEIGYLPYPDYKESVSKTLEYSYDDFCIWRMANDMDRLDDMALYRIKALNYKNVFDSTSNFMRGRYRDGSWLTPFSPIEWGGPYTEGNAWHYTWSVQHDPQGLIDLMGGNDQFVAKLDSLFNIPSEFKVGTYKRVIHEMTEMVLTDMGQYNHGNQPVHHVPYLYSYAGQPWKTQHRVRKILTELYNANVDGYPGDEDNGSLSGWYIFSSLGFFPVCPGSGEYVFGAPLFKKATIQLGNGKNMVIEAPENSSENYYVENVEINGERIERNYLTHNELMNGGKITFDMDNKPNKKRGTDPEDSPFSLTNWISREQ